MEGETAIFQENTIFFKICYIQMSVDAPTYVVVGGGIAGVSCVEMICMMDPDTNTVLVSASPVVKSVTELSHVTKLLTSFSVTERPVTEWQREHRGVTVTQGYVTGIRERDQVVELSDGTEIQYKKLCLCTGGSPRSIDRDNPHVLTIRDTESAFELQERLRDSSRVVIVGNGGIATELVYELRNIQVVWAIKDKSITRTFIDPGAAEFFMGELNKDSDDGGGDEVKPTKRMRYSANEEGFDKKCQGGALGPDWHAGLSVSGDSRHASKCVHIELQTEVAEVWTRQQFVENGAKEESFEGLESEKEFKVYVKFTNGKVVGCDFVVSATGVTPEGSRWASVLDVSEEGAILIDDNMRTSVENIYSAGDVCQPSWDPSPHWFQMRLWTQARQMGMFAGKCMVSHLAEEPIELDFCFEMFTHVTKFFGFKLILLGLFNGQGLGTDYEVLLRMTPGVEFVKCVMRNGRMQGAILIGETDLEETFENLILNQMDLSQFGEDLLDPNIDIEDFFD